MFVNILFCLPGIDWGGSETEPVPTLARALTDSGGVQVSFIQFSKKDPAVRHEGDKTFIPSRSSLSQRLLDQFAAERRMMVEEILRQKPDVIHVHWTQLGHGLAAMDSGIPYVVTAHDAALSCAFWNLSSHPSVILFAGSGLLTSRKVFRHANHIIAVSPYVEKHIRRFFLPKPRSGLPEDGQSAHGRIIPPLSIIPNPVDHARPESGPDSDFNHRGFYDTQDSPTFAAIGYWGRLKNLQVVLKAFQRVRKRLPTARLLLIGKDLSERGPCWFWAVSKSLDVGVRFLGPMPHDDVRTLLQRSVHCLVHPSRTEGFSLVVAEAMASGVPVITSNEGALPWLLEDGKCGVIIPDRDPQSWSDAMLKVIGKNGQTDPAYQEEVEQKKLHAIQRVASLCDPRHVANLHKEIYAAVLNK